jgi:hypothetical protein
MKERRTNVIWGTGLILIGILALSLNLNWIPDLTDNGWAIAFAAMSLLFLVGYFSGSAHNWGLLFPAVTTGGIAAIIWMEDAHVQGEIIGGLFLVLISLPFWVAIVQKPKTSWWALIPGWTLAAIGVIVMLSSVVHGEIISSLVLWSIALPFLVVYLYNRSQWWALIPAYTMGAVGLIPLMESFTKDELIGAYVMFAIAIPFFYVYLRHRQNWWALIPAGILSFIGLVLLSAALISGELFGALVLLGISLTFGYLWTKRDQHKTGWAIFPAIALAVMAALVLIPGSQPGLVTAVLLIAFGFWIIYKGRQPEEVTLPKEPAAPAPMPDIVPPGKIIEPIEPLAGSEMPDPADLKDSVKPLEEL